jgi:hypothetical protein
VARERLRVLRRLLESEGWALAKALNQQVIDIRATEIVRNRVKSSEGVYAQEFDKGHIEGREAAFLDIETQVESLEHYLTELAEKENESEDPQAPTDGILA